MDDLECAKIYWSYKLYEQLDMFSCELFIWCGVVELFIWCVCVCVCVCVCERERERKLDLVSDLIYCQYFIDQTDSTT